ncbi:MAG TPA: hypothetical protein PKD16_06225 [Saprospiraceae bacterium]|nr:hypothetical protein [Saprospiraceae bacterium]HMT69738.1 hypothetical protein [Saprospiraceae bacterium]
MKIDKFEEQQKTDSIWPLSLLAITSGINWLLYFKFGHDDLSFFYMTMSSIGMLCLLLFALRLHTVVTDKTIRFKMFPFHWSWQEIAWHDVASSEIRSYKPWSEYGGWGLRRGKSGKAYTISGKTGLQLTMKTGEKILIGTNQSEALKKVIG